MANKRLDEDCCDSGLGSLLEGQLWSLSGSQDTLGYLQASDSWVGDGESLGPKTSGNWDITVDTPGSKAAVPLGNEEERHKGSGELEHERFDSALGESLQEEDVTAGELGELVHGVQRIQLEQQTTPVSWAGGVCGYISEEGDTALHLAVIHEHEAFLDAILQYMGGTEFLDLQNDLGQTALHIAVIIGLPVFAQKLILAGAGLCIPEKAGNTVLHLACKEGRRACAEVLLSPKFGKISEIQKVLDCTNYDSFTALHIAVLHKDLVMVKLLLSAGADMNKPELSCGRSPLHLAVESQSPEVVECLLQAGADKDAQMYVGYTPIYSAKYRPDKSILHLLRHYGSREPDWDSEESLDMSSDEEEDQYQKDAAYDDFVINSIQCKN
ncbi:NF-kappa-B inhibitor beta [Ambystoma mexicanum]|uniref:NF-kappa-B inhibitor beta n=1 Tax=Ambystoma mexicanum TaxID=8296 RepID=UPI0037E81947